MAIKSGNKKSRYSDATIYSQTTGINKGLSRMSTKYYKNIPETETDIYVITQWGDRLDLLANEYYGNSHLWWYIAKANNLKYNNLPEGIQLRIPGTLDFI